MIPKSEHGGPLVGPKVSLNENFELGVTASALDVRAVFSRPITF